jgi:hypothetical protein
MVLFMRTVAVTNERVKKFQRFWIFKAEGGRVAPPKRGRQDNAGVLP